MDGFFSNLADSAVAILDGAQPTFDGGIFSYMGNSYVFNSSSPMPSASQHVKSTILSNGYFWALLCGILWIVTLLLIACVLACLHYRRNNSASKISIAYRRVAWRLQRMERRKRTNSSYIIFRLILIGVTILCVVPLIFAFVVNAKLHSYATAHHKSDSETAIFPKVNAAVEHTIEFMRNFAPHAREAAKPVIKETIRRTLEMADKSRSDYQRAYKKELGVTDLFNATGRLMARVSANYYSFKNLSKNLFLPYMQTEKRSAVFTLKLIGGIGGFLNEAKSSYSSLKDYCSSKYMVECEAFESLLLSAKPLLRIKDDSAITGILVNGNTLANGMEKMNQTPDKIAEQSADGKRKSEEVTKSLNERFNRELNSTELIINTTNAKWDLMEVSMIESEQKIRNITAKLFRSAPSKVSKYENLRYTAFLICLLAMVPVFIFAIYVSVVGFSSPNDYLPSRRRHCLKCCNLLLFLIIAVNVMLAMVVFLMSGYLQTEVCRYLQEEPPVVPVRNSSLQLDYVVNNFVKHNWQALMAEMKKSNASSAFPVPKPRDPFYGLKTVCRNNGPIMVALNALESFDTAAMADDSATRGLLAKGRRLMAQVLNETDSVGMLPAGTEENMKQLNQSATMFISKNKYDLALQELSTPLYSVDLELIQSNWTSLAFKLSSLQPQKQEENIKRISQALEQAMAELAVMKHAQQHLIVTLQLLKKSKDVLPLIKESLFSFRRVKANMMNKPSMIATALRHYDNIIVKQTLVGAAKVAEYSALGIMGVIGPCLPLYKAYTAVTAASCDATVRPLAAFYFSIGWCVFLSTSLMMALLLLLSKRNSSDAPHGNVSSNQEKVVLPDDNFSSLPMLAKSDRVTPKENGNHGNV